MRLPLLAAALLVSAVAFTTRSAMASTYVIQSQTGSLDLGSVTIDTTDGLIQTLDLSTSLHGAAINFDGAPATQGFSPYTNEYIATVTENGDTLQFNLPTSTLVNYVPAASVACGSQAEFCDYLANVYSGPVRSADLLGTFEGNLVTAPTGTSVTPEPSSIALLGTGLLGICGAVRRRWS